MADYIVSFACGCKVTFVGANKHRWRMDCCAAHPPREPTGATERRDMLASAFAQRDAASR